jgi:hypothetical protein
MKRLKTLTVAMAAVFALSGAVCADDGEITNKRMSDEKDVPDAVADLPEVFGITPEAEHAFTGMMGFYVPMQGANGATGELLADDPEKDPRDYYNIDGDFVETLEVAKPLVNVYIYGPALEVHATAFAHSYMDTYGAVSLDDGQTFKVTNLSDSAEESSFDLETDHVPGEEETLPADHTVDVHNDGVLHAPGYKTPYESHCVECHGVGLQGSAQVPSCYSCHGVEWNEDAPEFVGPIVMRAVFNGTDLNGLGTNALDTTTVSIVNGATGEAIGAAVPVFNGDDGEDFSFSFNLTAAPPCTVAATYGDIQGPAISVTGTGGEPIEACEGLVPGEDDDPETGTPYPGGTYNVVHAVAGNKVLVAWPSRFCPQGQPTYSIAWDGDDEGLSEEQLAKREALEDLLKINVDKDLYLTDLFGVAGKQGSIDFADEGYPQAGIVPFGCVWTARGILLPGDDPRTEENIESSYMLWTKAERLTSGRRDPNRIEVAGQVGAGFVITWQEDPDGLRPGQGEGPGEGWSGAVAHDKTDIWYSFINWEYFDLLENPLEPAGDYIMAEDFILGEETGRPQVYVPMAVPMRLSNNDKCQAEEYGPGMTPSENKAFSYCNYDIAKSYGLQDFCADTVDVPQGPQGELKPICVNDDGLPNIANTASTRPRTALHGYDTDDDGVFDSGWVIVAAEESKGLGRYQFLPDGTPCDEDAEDASPDCSADIGKNQWYYSFDMGEPETSDTDNEPYGLVQNLVSQGNLLNQPEVDWRTGEYFPVINTSEMWDFGDYNYDMYNTEIARRSSLLAQPITKAVNSTSRLLAIPSWKQGQMRQGGPADVMLRRIVFSAEDCGTLPQPPAGKVPYCEVKNKKETTKFVAPDKLDDLLDKNPDYYAGYCTSDLACDYEQTIDDNPYAFDNVVCDTWLVAAGTSPYYPGGICGDPATNLSGVIPDTCYDDGGDAAAPCPTVDFTSSTFGIGDTNPILQGYTQQDGNTTRVLTWHQCPSEGVPMADHSDIVPVTCSAEERPDEFMNLRDQSWYNPLDVAKGHRGFIDGDFVMYLYAWSPTWRLNAKGNDRYDLYVRRSFDGGATWTTTPADGMATDLQPFGGDGTVTCENYRDSETGTGDPDEPQVCYEFAAGAAEHARNVTQHKSMKTTTLDPRYAPTFTPTWGGIASTCLLNLGVEETEDWSCDDGSDFDSDARNASRFFMVFETGDNNTVQEGEAEPLDLFYGRGESFGDDFVVWTETDTGFSDPLTECFPSYGYDVLTTDDPRIGSGFCNEFDNMNTGGDSHASEASLVANPDGSKLYGVWAEWVFADDDDYESDITESVARARRVWWIDEYISETEAYSLPGANSDN